MQWRPHVPYTVTSSKVTTSCRVLEPQRRHSATGKAVHSEEHLERTDRQLRDELQWSFSVSLTSCLWVCCEFKLTTSAVQTFKSRLSCPQVGECLMLKRQIVGVRKQIHDNRELLLLFFFNLEPAIRAESFHLLLTRSRTGWIVLENTPRVSRDCSALILFVLLWISFHTWQVWQSLFPLFTPLSESC